MKRKLLLLATLIFTVALSVTGCGNTDITYLKEIKDINKLVKVGQYKGLTVEVSKTPVTEEYVQYYVDYMLSENAEQVEVTDRPVQMGDIANIDYAGYKDGVQFEGGTAQGYDLGIGTGTFIDGFEDGLIGASIGETRTLALTFPEAYGNADLAGQAVEFEVTVNAIKTEVVPTFDDAFVKTLGIEGVETTQEYKDFIRGEMEKESQTTFERDAENMLLQTIMEDSQFEELPDKMVTRYYTTMMERMNTLASSYGMSLDSYLANYYGMTKEQCVEQIQTGAEDSVRQYLILKAIAVQEGLDMTEDEMNAGMEEVALSSGYESVEEFKETVDQGTYEEYILGEAVLAYLMQENTVNEAVAQTVED